MSAASHAADDGGRRRCLVSLPATASGGRPQELLQAAGLEPRLIRSIYADSATTLYEVRSRAGAPEGNSAGLVHAEKIAGTGVPHPRIERLAELVAASRVRVPAAISGQAVREHLDRMGPDRDPVDLLARLQLLCTTADDPAFPSTAVAAHLALLQVSNEHGEPLFPAAAAHVVVFDAVVRTRAKLTAFLVRHDHDTRLHSAEESERAAGRQALENAHLTGEMVFASSEARLDGLFLLDSYIGPVLGALTPAIWAFPVVRAFGTTVLSLGTPLPGLRDGVAAEPLQMLSTQSAAGGGEFPDLHPRACSDALSWWTVHLDRFLAVVTDPTGFVGVDQHYRPQRHLQCLASVDQVFRRVHSVQTAYRDSELRLVAFFSVLDTLQDLTGHDLVGLCMPGFARKVLQELRATMTPPAAGVLLWGAERAVNALEELQDGFFLPRQAGQNTIAVAGGPAVPLPQAVGYYIGVLRNATHGFGGRRGDVARTEALLANHTGRVPHDLPMVAYLYLLYMLTRPDMVRRNTARRAATDPAKTPRQ